MDDRKNRLAAPLPLLFAESMSALHDDEIEVTEADARRLVDTQTPWPGLPLGPAGAGTDNRMFRLGDDLAVRLPRRPGTAADVAKEQRWLPMLAPHLPLAVPEPVFRGSPDASYPYEWSVLRWIEGAEPTDATIDDWAAAGRDLADFVRALHAVPVGGARREDGLHWYRGDRLADHAAEGHALLRQVRTDERLAALDLDLDAVERVWRAATGAPDPIVPEVWLHGDLRSANLVARDGRLRGVIDFGALSLGNPTAEHAAVWELPRPARTAYRERLEVDDATWLRASGWAVLVAMAGIPYYWQTWPEFAQAGVRKIQAVLAESSA